MTSLGNIVSRFQVKEGDETTIEKAKESKPPVSGIAHSGGPNGPVSTRAPPTGPKVHQKPALPGRKPTKLPSGVALRKQRSGDQPPPGGEQTTQRARQTSVSFTTEDLDLFQRRPQYTEQPPTKDKTDVRRSSRRVSAEAKDSSSAKRRSRSVGAPAFGGLRPLPPGNKPTLPSKPVVKRKPAQTTTRQSPSALPRPLQSVDTSSDDTLEDSRPRLPRPVSGNRNKSYRHAVRPVSGARKSKQTAENCKKTAGASTASTPGIESATTPAVARLHNSKPFPRSPTGSSIPVPSTHHKVAPNVSPKPTVQTPLKSPVGPARTVQVLENLAVNSDLSDDEVKAVATVTILAALAKRSNAHLKSPSPKPFRAHKFTDGETQGQSSLNVEGLTITETTDHSNFAKSITTCATKPPPPSPPPPPRPHEDIISQVIEGVTTTETDETEKSVEGTNDNGVALASESTIAKTHQNFSAVEELKQELNSGTDNKTIIEPRRKIRRPATKPCEPPPPPPPTLTPTQPLSPPPPPPPSQPPTQPPSPPPRPTQPPPSRLLITQQQEVSSSDESFSKTPPVSIAERLRKCSPAVSPKPNPVPVKLAVKAKLDDSSIVPSPIAGFTGGQVGVTTEEPPLLDDADIDAWKPSNSTQRRDSPPNANDADDEAEPTLAQKVRVYMKSFSLEQKDIHGRLVDFTTAIRGGRPTSEKVLSLPGESTRENGAGRNPWNTTRGKKGVLDKLRKITSSGAISEDQGHTEKRQVEDTTFYVDLKQVPGTTDGGERHVSVGKTTFYGGDKHDSAHEQQETSSGNGAAEEGLPGERRSKVLLRHSGAGRRVSNKSYRSGIFVENELRDGENGTAVYQNVLIRSISERHARGSPPMVLDEEKSVCSLPSDADGLATTQPRPGGEMDEEQEEVIVKAGDIMKDCAVSANVPLKEPSVNNIYSNVEFTSTGYRNLSVWRRRTIKRGHSGKKKKKKRDTDQVQEAVEVVDEEVEFSNSFSDDSFDSDTFTDDSEEGGEEVVEMIEAVNQNVQGNAVPPEEPKVPKTTKLKLIANELLTTEEAYVKRLHLIDQVFHLKIVIENRAHHMFPDDVIPQMFSNIKSIYQFHNDFLLPQLKKRMEGWDDTPKLGDLMRKFAPFLKLYSEYVKNFDHAVNTINMWTQRSHLFANILQELQKKPECGMLTLQHHMLEPIQRVPRYEMLLKDYLKHLPADSDDAPDTKKALELVTTAAAHANETMWKMEKFRKLLDLNETFGGVVNLIDPSRELLKEGKIFKISAGKGLLYERYMFLFTDMLILCTSNRIGLTRSYRINNLLQLNGMQVQDGDNLDIPFTFYIKSKTKTIELHSNTQEEMADWCVSIDEVITDYKRRQNSRLTIIESINTDKLGVCAPKWVKDQNTSMCMLCGTNFSMLKRRHHCRCCGIVVCARCSSHKAPLPYQDNKPDRVCDNCYETLCGRAENSELNSNSRVKGILQVKGTDPSVVSGMMQFSTDKKIWERRWFTLHDDFVLYTFKAPQDVHAMTSLPLPGYTVTEVKRDDSQSDKEQIIKLSHAGTKKVYYFHLESNYTKWLTALQCALKLELPPDYVPSEKKDTND